LNIKQRTKLVILVALIAVVVDQLTKLFIYGCTLFKGTAAYPIIKDFLYIKLIQNTGIGFGLMQGQNTLIIFLTVLFLGVIIYNLDDIARKKWPLIFTGLLIGGAIGNLMDRICLHFVRDFIAFTFWPAFNFADVAITIGGIGLIIYFIREENKK